MEKYEIYLNGSLIESSDLLGLAVLKFESARLLGDASLIRFVSTGDCVIDGRFLYEDGGWTYKGPASPPCPASKECKYRQPYETPGLQRNALRIEIMYPSHRCGWNLKKGRMGGRPDDYHPCTFQGAA